MKSFIVYLALTFFMVLVVQAQGEIYVDVETGIQFEIPDGLTMSSNGDGSFTGINLSTGEIFTFQTGEALSSFVSEDAVADVETLFSTYKTFFLFGGGDDNGEVLEFELNGQTAYQQVVTLDDASTLISAFALPNGEPALVLIINFTGDAAEPYAPIVLFAETFVQDESLIAEAPEVLIPSAEVPYAAMPDGVLYFGTNAEMRYPDTWTLDTGNETVLNTATLTTGLMGTTVATVTYDGPGTSMDRSYYVNSLLPMMAMMWGIEDFNASMLQEVELADGRFAEALIIKPTEELPIYGIYYIVPVTEDSVGSIMAQAYFATPEEASDTLEADVLAMASSFKATEASLAFLAEQSGVELISITDDTGSPRSVSLREIDCLTTGDVVLTYEELTAVAVDCPEGCLSSGASVWGSDVYTSDSSVCLAAIHAGAITDGGGRVLATLEDGLESYTGSERNAVVTSDYESWDTSLTVKSLGQ